MTWSPCKWIQPGHRNGSDQLALIEASSKATETSCLVSAWGLFSHRTTFGKAELCSLGSPIGGIIADTLGWRWAFYLQIPLLAIAAIMVFWRVRYVIPEPPTSGTATPSMPKKKQTAMEKLKRIDFLGCFLLAGWVGSALLAVSLKTNSTELDAYKWTDPLILGLFVTSAVVFVIFMLVEKFVAAEPVLPLELLTKRTPVSVALNNMTISILGFGTVSTMILDGGGGLISRCIPFLCFT